MFDVNIGIEYLQIINYTQCMVFKNEFLVHSSLEAGAAT